MNNNIQLKTRFDNLYYRHQIIKESIRDSINVEKNNFDLPAKRVIKTKTKNKRTEKLHLLLRTRNIPTKCSLTRDLEMKV